VTRHAHDRSEHARIANVASLELLVDHADALGIEAAACALRFDRARTLHADGDDKIRPRRPPTHHCHDPTASDATQLRARAAALLQNWRFDVKKQPARRGFKARARGPHPFTHSATAKPNCI
jgi:hypothetical protein